MTGWSFVRTLRRRRCRGHALARALAKLLGLLEGRPHVLGHHTSGEFNRNSRRKSFIDGQHTRLNALLDAQLVVHAVFERGRDGLEKTVRKKDAEEGADERRADFVADLRRRAVNRL